METHTNYDYLSPVYLSNWGWQHLGVDIKADYNAPVFPVASGEVYVIEIDKSAKRYTKNSSRVYVRHKTNDGKVFTAIYGHCEAPSTLKEGDTVSTVQSICNIRRFGSPDHLHFEIQERSMVTRKSWGWLDPKRDANTAGWRDPNKFLKNNHPSETGPGTSTPPTDPPASGKLPDFITSKVILAKENGQGERYTWKVNETAYVHSWTDNIGKKDWEGKAKKILVPFYLSKGSKEDSHSTWVRVGREEIKKGHLDVKDKPNNEDIAFNIRQWAAAGYIYPGRTYNFVVCADRPNDQDNGDGDVKEVHKSNNCSTPAVFYVDYGPARNVDVMASNLALAGGKSSLQAGEAYGFQADISNIGTQYPWNGCRTSYEIKGPGTGGAWQKVADEGSTVAQLGPNSTHVEVIDESRGLKAPAVGGDYVFRACADYEQAIPETDESNNCTAELPVTVTVPPPPPAVTPRIVITNPTRGEDWRSDERKHIEWTYDDFPSSGKVKIEYSMDGGASWQTIEESTTNDGGRYWEMCDFHTVDSHHSYIRITSVEYPEATDMSDEFSIDHAKECK
jgi:hypothetical protein